MNLRKVDTLQQLDEKLINYFGGRLKQTEKVALMAAPGRILSQDIVSDADMPPFTRSVVDGYAVQASDTFGVSESVPVFLKLVGQVPMGELSRLTIQAGEAVYVPTGAMIPEGADGAVMIEHTELFEEDTVAIHKPIAPGNNLLKRGEDLKTGTVVLRAGDRIGVKDIGVLACLGKTSVSVYKKPRVALISTGDELVEMEKTPLPGQIRDVNAPLISAFLTELGAQVTGIQLIKDDFDVLCRAARQALEESDILLISGGSSQGNKDMTENVMTTLGSPGVFTHGLALKPGKPAIFGAVGRNNERDEDNEGNGINEMKLVAGLPGHPMSAIVVYLAVIEPFICRYFLNPMPSVGKVLAQMTENIHAGEGRETWQPVTLCHMTTGQVLATPLHGKSGSIYQLSLAHGFVRIPLMSEGVVAGETVEVTMLPV